MLYALLISLHSPADTYFDAPFSLFFSVYFLVPLVNAQREQMLCVNFSDSIIISYICEII